MKKKSRDAGPQTRLVILESITRIVVAIIPTKLHSSRRELFYGFLFALGITMLVQWFEYHGVLASAEGHLFDAFVAVDPWDRDRGSAARIVTLEIDDQTYTTAFEDTSPLKPDRVESLISAVQKIRRDLQAPPTVFGVDLLTDSTHKKYAEQYLHWDFDKENSEIVWVSGIADERPEPKYFHRWLGGLHEHFVVKPTGVLGRDWVALQTSQPPISWGIPVFPREDDLRLRRLLREFEVSADPHSSASTQPHPTWAAAVARKYCETPSSACPQEEDRRKEVFVSYGLHEPLRFEVKKVFRYDDAGQWMPMGSEDFTTAITDRHTIILVGGTYGAARDFYDTPKGRIPGLLLNAYAIQAELSGMTISEAWRPVTIVLDILLGMVIGAFIHKAERFRKVILVAFGSVAAAVLISACLFWWGIVWVSCIGVAAGMPLHLLLEVAILNPEVPHPH